MHERRFARPLCRALPVVLVLGCVTQRVTEVGQPEGTPPDVIEETERLLDLSLDRWIERVSRVQRISQRIRLAGREMCAPHLTPILGVAVLDLARAPKELAYPARQRFGDGTGVPVAAVFDDMAAARAGLRPGDILLGVGDRPPGADDVDGPEGGEGPIVLELSRAGERLSLAVEREPGCAYPVYLSPGEWVNAWADGREVRVDSGLVRLMTDDTFLAFVIGHELAHDLNIAAGYDELQARGVEKLEAEARADYVGIYLASRAGYPVRSDPEIFVSFLQDINDLGKRAVTHPTTHARTLAMRKTIEEIERKRRAGEPLLPTLR